MKIKQEKMKKILTIFILILSIVSCKTVYVPIQTDTSVNVKDSTVLNIKDSIRITEATKYRDMAWLGDTLRIRGQRSRMWAVADTVKEAIIGGLEEDKVEEHYKIIYKDRWKTRDSLVFKEVPVPVVETKIEKYIPKWCYYSLVFSILVLLGLGLKYWLKFKGIAIADILRKFKA